MHDMRDDYETDAILNEMSGPLSEAVKMFRLALAEDRQDDARSMACDIGDIVIRYQKLVGEENVYDWLFYGLAMANETVDLCVLAAQGR